jgi:nicotinate-nucleotide--dimethylbenzimidazole phosphoribosyltransferase
LGRIEELAVQLCAIAGTLQLGTYGRRAILIGAADHGVVADGVSAYPPEVTAQMVAGFASGHAAISAFARTAGAAVTVIDFGVGNPTRNLAREAALSSDEVDAALAQGERAVTALLEGDGFDVIALGEMGIGNTTSAAAIIAALTGSTAEEVAGRGTGIDDEGLARKVRAIDSGLARCTQRDWRSVACELGGREILGLAGALVAAARARRPIVLDGVVVGAAALLAQAIAPESIGYCIAAHRSVERGHAIALRALGLRPLFDLELRLGEASGAALALPFVESAARMLTEMYTFEEAGVALSVRS